MLEYEKGFKTQLSYNRILHRDHIERQVISFLESFSSSSTTLSDKKGIYIYGAAGSGKTKFISDILNQNNYDIIRYDAGNIRNKALIESITSNHVSTYNVLSLMEGKKKKLAILMDEIDGMNSGDKGGINALIKLIRHKKTKKQKDESLTKIPIIAIGNYMMDKKISELMRVCHVMEIQTPTAQQMTTLLQTALPMLNEDTYLDSIISFLQGDLRKFNFIESLLTKRPHLLLPEHKSSFFKLLKMKSKNDTAKQCVYELFSRPIAFRDHASLICETDRTTISLLWHENIIDRLDVVPKSVDRVRFYMQLLKSICFADYMDRLTFQNQIWIFNEMTFLLKTMKTNSMYHQQIIHHGKPVKPLEDVRFTKVLTKYSTEYNNTTFLYFLCQEMHMERKDCIGFFTELRVRYGQDYFENSEYLQQVYQMHFGNTELKLLDIKRLYRYLDKSNKKSLMEYEE